ncbi:LysR family transcriptional regulator [Flavimaricola marinus]|uniref:LysR family transcriptional regulator n=1 Tax=Flavimaricola marinus TaxID=1819565 RepID=UPI0027BA7C87|nr:LysR family transcriptional regulator [Flavimaricola marinus]
MIQAFLAVAETGSLSAAARQLGASQPTLGRQIKAIEAQLDAELFHRHAKGFELTETGLALVPAARQMREAVNQIALTAAGQAGRLEGTVRITSSDAISVFHLPEILAHIREVEPQIALELVPSDTSTNLLYREADIAVRMYRPTQLDLVTQHIGDLKLAMFAAKSYVARRGIPADATEFLTHDLVGYDANPAMLEAMTHFGLPVTRDSFKTRCDANLANWALVRAGCGIGFGQAQVGRADPSLQEISLDYPLPLLPVWLTAHEAMRQSPRIRRVWDLLADGLRKVIAADAR